MKYLFPWRLPLVGLIAINLFLTGLLVGPQIRPFAPTNISGIADHIIGELVDLVDERDGAQLKAAFARNRAELLATAEQFRDARAKVPPILSADPLDRDKLEAALTEAALSGRAVETAMRRMLTDVATSLSPAGRRKIAAFLASKAPP